MALRNPIFNNSAFQQDPRAVQSYPGGQQATSLTPPSAAPQGDQQNIAQQAQWAGAQQGAQAAAVNANLDGMFTAPPAGAIETGRMTVEDTVWKTAGLFALMLVAAVAGWFWTTGGNLVPAAVEQPNMMPWMIGALGGFVLAMVITFTSRKKIRPGLIFAYAALEGLFVGGISAYFEAIWPGIVMQATLATVSVVAVTLALFASGKIRASAKMTKIVMIAMLGYLVFSLLNVVLMWTGVFGASGGFGMLSEVKIMGIPLGLIIGVVVVIMAAYSLVLDFDGIQQGVRNGAPREYGWMGAFGIMVTVVWLYIEILRMIAIARSSD